MSSFWAVDMILIVGTLITGANQSKVTSVISVALPVVVAVIKPLPSVLQITSKARLPLER